MSAAKQYYFSHFLGGSTHYGQVKNGVVNFNPNRFIGADGSHYEPFFSTQLSQQPEATFNTTMLTTMLTQCTYFGLSTAALVGYRLGSNLGARTAVGSALHSTFTAATGFLYPQSISAPMGQIASAAMRYIPIYNGSALPFVYAGTATIAGLGATPSFEAFTLSSITSSMGTIDSNIDLQINFGHNLNIVGADDDFFPTFVGVNSIVPVFTLKSFRIDLLSIFGSSGSASPSEIVFYFRNKTNTGGHTPNATTSHIKCTVPVHHSYVTEVGADDLQPGQSGIMICPQASARATPQMTWATGVALP